MLRNKGFAQREVSPKFSVTQEKHARDIESLTELVESSNLDVQRLNKTVAYLTEQVTALNKKLEALLALNTLKGDLH